MLFPSFLVLTGSKASFTQLLDKSVHAFWIVGRQACGHDRKVVVRQGPQQIIYDGKYSK